MAGVLAAGCLMPGFAEAAELYKSSGVGWTEVGTTATINSANNNTGATEEVYWKPGAGDTSVQGCTINVNPGIITPSIKIYGGYYDNTADNPPVINVNNNAVKINGTTFGHVAIIRGGYSNSGKANDNRVSISGGTFNGLVDIKGGFGSKAADGNSVSISDSTFNGLVNVQGGEGSTANGNSVDISDSTFNGLVNVRGGYSNTGEATTGNRVSISGGTFKGDVYGGTSSDGTAEGNSVIISGGTIKGSVHGGTSSDGTAEGNSVIISDSTITSDVYGGYSSNGTANKNKVILVGKNANNPLSADQTRTGSGKININGTVYGGHVSGSNSYNSTDNEIHVYGSDINVGHIAGFNKLHFFIDDTMTFGETMLTINGLRRSDGNMSYPNVSIPNNKLAVTVSGKPNPSVNNNTDNTITLVDYPNGTIDGFVNGDPVDVKIGATLSGDGSVALTDNAKKLVLTLNVEVNENGKSLVETRAAAAFVVNNMSDFMLGTGMEQAKAAAGGVTPIDAGTMAPFAAIGGSNMRYTTGSYVDVNGWNGAVGFAKQADKLLFGVAVEHGRGNYDSYLDSGVHASGDIKSTGGVIFGEYKLDNGVHYDAALRAGRVKSDYNSTATSYDESSTYYGFSLGGGKELTVSDKATLDVYGRYYFSHTNGSDVSIATGEEIDFDAVNSHRLRIGGRYTTTLTEKSKAYAGLAWQYEFGGDAKAAINGYSAPTPSLQGHSAIVEAGYKLNAGKNLTLDFNLNGAMGKQRGIGGGIGAQWLF